MAMEALGVAVLLGDDAGVGAGYVMVAEELLLCSDGGVGVIVRWF
jgi:hypothetical protein